MGMIAAQVAHAAGSIEKHPAEMHVVVLQVSHEAELYKVSTALSDAGIGSTLVVETDPPYSGQGMAIGCHPVRDRAQIRRVLSSLPLLGKELSLAAA